MVGKTNAQVGVEPKRYPLLTILNKSGPDCRISCTPYSGISRVENSGITIYCDNSAEELLTHGFDITKVSGVLNQVSIYPDSSGLVIEIIGSN